jgi:hypothetical protein
MAAIPESQHTTAAQIVKWYSSKPQQHRPHMGASIIGHKCDRYIWLTWRWALKPDFPGRLLRMFDTGSREEERLVAELQAIGATVWQTDPETDAQWRVSACDGHFAGSLDGVAKGLPEAQKTPAVLEFKTHNNKSFSEVVRKGVEAAKPQHFAQMQIYMGLITLDRALYLAVNKDTDDLYSEWVHFDKDEFAKLMARAERLIESTTPPWRISTDKDFFECKYCPFWKHCHGGQAAEPNCRTCCHASPIHDAQWRCAVKGELLSEQDQRNGCDDHLMIPDLVPFADPQDGGENWVAYRHKESGAMFVNGPESIREYGPHFSSIELHQTNGSLISAVIDTKNQFPISVVASGTTHTQPVDDLLERISTHPDDIEVKAPTKAAKEKAAAIKKSVKTLEKLRK